LLLSIFVESETQWIFNKTTCSTLRQKALNEAYQQQNDRINQLQILFLFAQDKPAPNFVSIIEL
jgi:hypothetical protein